MLLITCKSCGEEFRDIILLDDCPKCEAKQRTPAQQPPADGRCEVCKHREVCDCCYNTYEKCSCAKEISEKNGTPREVNPKDEAKEWEEAFEKKHWGAMFESGDYDALINDIRQLRTQARKLERERIKEIVSTADSRACGFTCDCGESHAGNVKADILSKLQGLRGE